MMKKFAMWFGMVVVLYAATELLMFTAISLKYGRVFTFSGMEAQRRDVHVEDPFGTADVPARYRIRKEVIHPYLGYVHDPAVEHTSPFGISDVSPVQHKSPDKVIIGIFGGSFAEDFAYNMGDVLAKDLQRYYPRREFVIVKGTIGGYKQPQQLMALNYFSALGGGFDIVINLDGFNDIALPVLENVPQTNPFFPRQWHLRMRMVPDTELVATIGEIRFLDSISAKWTSLFRTGPLRYSVTANTIWRIGDQLLYNAAVAKRAGLPQLSTSANDYAAAGPPAEYRDESAMYDDLARVWAESSYQMHVLAAAKGFRYFHFLQPNQYVGGTKPMSAEERRIAIREDHPYAASVRKGYPKLKELGRDLTRRGVNFVDLTRVFAVTRDPLYRDNCCHVNIEGLRIVETAIATSIRASLDAKAS